MRNETTKLHHEGSNESVWGYLECPMAADDPVAVGEGHDVSLLPEAADAFGPGQHLALQDALHCVHFLTRVVTHQFNLIHKRRQGLRTNKVLLFLKKILLLLKYDDPYKISQYLHEMVCMKALLQPTGQIKKEVSN